ncbi:phage tail tape measure protein [Dyella lutea]|uniref:Phage tail tape measure protein n=1 Tax=Dyella lutea TaxID=2950441 RepID=A0ABT1FDD0_9GAMM|nr:phage tail tape measure protein [Dyella lutea]MCP1375394.1 phage tail tape measure protein [Dyella lutea]
MSDTLKLAMRISAVDLFSGVLRRFRSEIAGSGTAAKSVQRDYDNMIRHTSAGLKSLAVGSYIAAKLKPAIAAAAELQESSLALKGILAGAHPNAAKLADQMERANQNAISVAKHMQYSAKEVMDVQTQLYQGGLPLKAILGGDKGAAFAVEALAEIRHVDPAETAANIANVGHSFQLRPEEYGPATDLIARGSILASGGLTQLFHNLDQVGARAHMLGNMDLRSTVIALKALSPLGEEAGSDLGAALAVMTGGSHRGQKWRKEWGLDFYKGGKFIGLDASLDELKKKMATQTQEQRNAMLGEVFGQTGGKAITQLLAPSLPGVKSYDEIKASLDQQASLSQQVATREEGLLMNVAELSSTNKTTLATLFDPMLGKMTEAIKLANKLDGAIGDIASHHKGLANGVSITAGSAIGAAALYGGYRLARGGLSLRAFLKGKAGLAAGIAEGKAVEAATGVQPVYVTNFPASLSSGVPGAAGKAAESAEKAAAKQVAAGGAGATLRGLLAVAAPVAAGAGGIYVFKKIAEDLPQQTMAAQDDADYERWKKGGRYDALQPSDEKRHLSAVEVAARRAVEAQTPYGTWYGQHKQAYHWWENSRPIDDWKKWVAQQAAQPATTQVGGSVEIKISQDGRARVGKVTSKNPNVPLDVGSMMGVP